MAKFVPQSEMPLSDQVKVRREKLENLRAEGFDPFVQTRFEVTSDSAAIKGNYEAMEGQSVRLAGRFRSSWSQRKASRLSVSRSVRPRSGRSRSSWEKVGA